jgi:hypothetical protein
MNLAAWALNNRVTVLVLTAVMLIGGIQAYGSLARLEDPEFTIKDGLVNTPYPGATAAEVEEEVSDKIEKAVQQLGQLDWIESTSYWGMSEIKAHIKDEYDKFALPQVWDELRRKVGDVQGQLPPGAGPSVVNDDFGDVWGVFIAIYGDDYTDAELRDVAKLYQKELLLVEDVAKIGFWGERREAIYVEPNRDRLSQLGLKPAVITQALRQKNVAADSGRVEVGPEFISIQPTGEIYEVEDFENLLLSEEGAPQQIYLRDVASVRRGYVEPPRTLLRYDGHRAIGLGISTTTGGNVVEMGKAVEIRARELLDQVPLGVEAGIISLQSEATTVAINAFLVNLVEAVAIVVGVLVLFMGLRSSLIIGFVLALTICATFIFMGPWDVALERISLGALVIALGMLVDNAIVVVDGVMVRMQKGMRAEEAGIEVVGQTSMPLLGATAVAVMAFGAIGLSNDGTGEYCRSLFKVVLISLSLSWVTAVTVTPVLAAMFLKAPVQKQGEQDDPYGGGFYERYRGLVRTCIRHRWVTLALVLGAFATSVYGFRYVDNSFFPDSTRPQFMLDMWMPQGINIQDTALEAGKVEEYLLGLEGVTHVSSLVGSGGMRFLLTYDPEKPNTSYVQFLVDVEDYRLIAGLVDRLEAHLEEAHADAMSYVRLFRLGPGNGGRNGLAPAGKGDRARDRRRGGQHRGRHEAADCGGSERRLPGGRRRRLPRERRAPAHHHPPAGAGPERRGQHPEPAHLELGRRPVHSAASGGVELRDGLRRRHHLPHEPQARAHRARGCEERTAERSTESRQGEDRGDPAAAGTHPRVVGRVPRLGPRTEGHRRQHSLLFRHHGPDRDRALQRPAPARRDLGHGAAGPDRHHPRPVADQAALRLHGHAGSHEPLGHDDQERHRADRRDRAPEEDQRRVHGHPGVGREPAPPGGHGRTHDSAGHVAATAGRLLHRHGGDDHLRPDDCHHADDGIRPGALRDPLPHRAPDSRLNRQPSDAQAFHWSGRSW